jgi:hypothetical protein
MRRSPNHLTLPDGTCSPNCYPCKLKGVTFAQSAMPTRHPNAAATKVGDRRLERDLRAYKAMRHNGVQPRHTRGAADFQAQASSEIEFSMGRIIPDVSKRRRLQEEFDRFDASTPRDKPIVRDEDGAVVV